MNEEKLVVRLNKQELALAHRALMELPLKRTDPAFGVCSEALQALASAFGAAQGAGGDAPPVGTPEA